MEGLEALSPEEREFASQMIEDENLTPMGLAAALEAVAALAAEGRPAPLLSILRDQVELSNDWRRRIWCPPDVSGKTQVILRSPDDA